MFLQPSILRHIHQLKKSPRGEYELTDALVRLTDSGTVRVCELKEYWTDIGTLEKLKDAEEWLSHRKA